MRRRTALGLALGALSCGQTDHHHHDMQPVFPFGMGGIGFPPATPLLPTDFPGLLLWLNADETTDTGNGTAITAWVDQSASGITYGEGEAGTGPIRRDATGRRRRFAEYSIGKWDATLDALIVNLGSGSPQGITIVEIYQPTGSGGLSYQWGWGSTTLTTRYNYKRSNGSFVDEIQQRDPTNNNTAVPISTGVQHLAPQVNITRYNAAGTQVEQRIDGVSQGTATLNRAATTMDIFGVGSNLRATSTTLSCQKLQRHILVYAGELSLIQCQLIEEWAATEIGAPGVGLAWKIPQLADDFGNNSNATLVIGIIGQSNGAGRGTSDYTSIYANTVDQGWCLYADMNLAALADPTADATNIIGNTVGDTVSTPATSFAVRLVDRLRQQGETRNIIVANCCVGATSSTAWLTGALVSPPAVTSLVGAAKHRIGEALKAPNSELMLVMYQGEADSASSLASYVSNWTTVFDELATYFAAYFAKSKKFYVVRSPTTAWTGTSGALWTDLRNSQASLVSGRADSVLVDAPGAGPFTDGTNLHLDTGANSPGTETGLMKLGIDIANAYLAAA